MKTLATLAVLASSALAGLLVLATVLALLGGDLLTGSVALVLTVLAGAAAFVAFNWLVRNDQGHQTVIR